MIVGKLVLVDPEPPYLSRVLNTSERMGDGSCCSRLLGRGALELKPQYWWLEEEVWLVGFGLSACRLWVEAENFDQKARWKTIL